MKLTDILSQPGQKPVLRVRQAVLEVVEGPDTGLCTPFTGSPIRIGTAPGCQIRLTDPAVSRLHGEVRLEGEAAVIRDLQSSNGTTIEGVSVRAAELNNGNVIRVGQTGIRFTVGERATEVDLWPRESYSELLGRSAAMRAIFALLDRVARTEATVLFQGETGTGKDLAATALHESSHRSGGPFVVVDCGAIPANLMEGELFGSVKGAYTGASQDRPGALEQAHGGTLFLDEVGELPLELQPKLLRFLENRRVKRLGATQYGEVDVRVVAATNRDLYREVEQGSFREDLFYRLNVITVELPPLRERTEDIKLLVDRFARKILHRLPDQPIDDVIPKEAVAALAHHRWPGNVRELYNHVQRMVALADPHLQPPGPARRSQNGSGEVSLDDTFRQAKDQAVRQFEKRYLQRLVERAQGNISAAARLGAMDRAHLYKLLRKHGLY